MTFKYVNPAVIRAAAEAGEHWYPHAIKRPIPENYTQPIIVPRGYMLHTMAGPRSTYASSLVNYMAREDIRGECHEVIGYDTIFQVIAFNIRADNNYKANAWWEGGTRYGFVSVETQDDGYLNNVEDDPWNEFQLEHLAGTAAFLHLRYGIPLDRCMSWTDGGVDGHRAFPEWSNVTGKTCPGEARWQQIPFVIALAQQIVDWRPTPVTPPEIIPPSPEENDMARINAIRLRIVDENDVVYNDQVVGLTIANPNQLIQLDADDDRLFSAKIAGSRAEIEAELGFKLTPST